MRLFARIKRGGLNSIADAITSGALRRKGGRRPQPLAAAREGAPLASGTREPQVSNLADGVLGYHLFLGRSPESDAVAQAMVGRSVSEMAQAFLSSTEFVERILLPAATYGQPSEWRSDLTEAMLTTSLTDELALDRDLLAAARSWKEVLGGLMLSPVPRSTLIALHGDLARALLSRVDDAVASLRQRIAATEAALDVLKDRAEGLSINVARDLTVLPDGSFRATSADPWIIVDLPFTDAETPYRLTLAMRTEGGATFAVKIYLDCGEGFSEEATIASAQDGGRDVHFVLAGLGRPIRVRIDPVDGIRDFKLDHLLFEPIPGEEFMDEAIREAALDRTEAFYRLRAARRLLADRVDVSADPTRAIALSRELTLLLTAETIMGDYENWIERYERPSADDYKRMAEMILGFTVRPTFSFLVPTYNTPIDLLEACVNSMLDQSYPDFTICIADDCSSDDGTTTFLDELAARDPRVRLARRVKNGHISEASNSALALVDGDFIVLVDHDDMVPDYCLFVLAEAINRQPHAKILFSDEDKLDPAGERCQPYFKTTLNSFLLYGHNMVSHLGVYHTELVRRVGGFRKSFEGSQDYDLALRCLEAVPPADVVHVPHVLYHWRMIAGSTAVAIGEKSYAASAAVRAVEDHFRRERLPLVSRAGIAPGLNGVGITAGHNTLVSIVIPTRDGLDLLQPCLASIASRSTGRYEVVVIDNGSSDPATLAYLADLSRSGRARVIAWPEPFNFSALNNFAVQHCTGELLCFLNNDTEVVSEGWLERARALLSVAHVGAVGARLLYPDGVLQHMGIVLGMGAHGIAGTPHGGIDGTSPGYLGKARLLAEFSAVTAACLFVRREDFLAIGGFDPALVVAYNDVDLCLKIRARGLKVLCDPDITLIHKESRTRGYDQDTVRAKRLLDEAGLFKMRWGKELREDCYYSPNHSLVTSSFDLAWPPRVPMPWLDLAAA